MSETGSSEGQFSTETDEASLADIDVQAEEQQAVPTLKIPDNIILGEK